MGVWHGGEHVRLAYVNGQLVFICVFAFDHLFLQTSVFENSLVYFLRTEY